MEYRGIAYSIDVSELGRGWTWSVVIGDQPPTILQDRPASTKQIAMMEAMSEAKLQMDSMLKRGK